MSRCRGCGTVRAAQRPGRRRQQLERGSYSPGERQDSSWAAVRARTAGVRWSRCSNVRATAWSNGPPRGLRWSRACHPAFRPLHPWPASIQARQQGAKHALLLSAFAALRDPVSRAYYARKVQQGKRGNQALIALAPRRRDVMFTMLRDGTIHQPKPAPNA